MFESGPFTECPNCKEKAFGVLIINDDGYWRRCKKCRYDSPSQIALPSLNKKIIYLDQFVISNMAKAITPQIQKHKPDPFWQSLYNKISDLCHKQLIACPASEVHESESILFPYPEILQNIYESISGDTKFLERSIFVNFEVSQFAEKWLKEDSDTPLKLERKYFINGAIDAWQKQFKISFALDKTIREDEKRYKENFHKSLKNVFDRYKNMKDFDFNECYKKETASFGESNFKQYIEFIRNYNPENFHDFPESFTMVNSVRGLFLDNGIERKDIWNKLAQFFTSDKLDNIPSVEIEGLLWASLARQYAKGGRKKDPGEGIVNDVDIISLYLPLCDAMFIDNECAELLRQKPACDRIGYDTKIFSLNNRDEFLNYLDQILKDAPEDVLKAVIGLYGK